jgi:hypothetical protein
MERQAGTWPFPTPEVAARLAVSYSNVSELQAHRRRWARPTLAFVASLGLMALMSLSLSRPAFAAAARPKIMVLVENYAQAPPALLIEAELEAGRILSKAGLRTDWFDCPISRGTAISKGPCEAASAPTDVRVRVFSAPSQNRFQEAVFGSTLAPILANVYYDHAESLAKRDAAHLQVSVILGCVIAHEVGHMLLGANSHSAGGIMQAEWGRQEVTQIMMGILLFTSQQSKLMQAQARTRMSLGTESRNEQRIAASIVKPN